MAAEFNPSFEFTMSKCVPDHFASRGSFSHAEIETQRNKVRKAYSNQKPLAEQPDYNREFETLCFMNRWNNHCTECSERGRYYFQNSNFVRWVLPQQELNTIH